jgi:hypothetical protein
MGNIDPTFRRLMEKTAEANSEVLQVWFGVRDLSDSPLREKLWQFAEETAGASARLCEALLR